MNRTRLFIWRQLEHFTVEMMHLDFVGRGCRSRWSLLSFRKPRFASLYSESLCLSHAPEYGTRPAGERPRYCEATPEGSGNRVLQLSRTASHSLSALAAGAILLSAVALTAAAQNVLPPDADNSELIFEETPQSIPQAPVPATASAPASVAAPVQASATKDSAAKEVWDDKPLRDPFWPVGYFPEGWQKAPVDGDSATLDSLGWKAAAAKIRVSGTSLMNGKTAAVVDGSLKVEGDVIEVKHDGRIYQWLVASIDDQGQIHLKKQGIK